MRRTEALASVKFYQILSIFIFFIRLTILEDFIRLISYNGPCVRLGCSFLLATALDEHPRLFHMGVTPRAWTLCLAQCAKKDLMSDSPGLLDFAIRLMNSVFDGQVMFFEQFE